MSFTLQHVFAYPWAKVTQAFWEKYPHPAVPHVKEALVLSRTLDDDGRLRTKRLMCVQQPVPSSLRPFSRGLDTFYAVEESIVDAKEQILELTSHNVSFARLVDASTTSKYVAIKGNDNAEHTLLTTQVTVKAKRFPKIIASKLEHTLVTSALRNAHRGIIAMEEICTSRFGAMKANG